MEIGFMAIAERLKNRRTELGLKQAELAKKAVLTQGTISLIESGDRSIKAEELTRLADALNTTVHYLVTGKDLENSTVCEDLHLSNETVNHLRTNRDHLGGMALDILVQDWRILDLLYYYLHYDYNNIRFWEQESGGGYVREIPVSDLMGSIPEDALATAVLLQIMERLKKLREVIQNGKHQKTE